MVAKDSFSFCGVDMLDAYGIRAVTHDVLLPRLRPRTVTVPGRDGVYDFGARWYEDRVVRIDCDSMRALGRGALRELAALLARKGPLVLWDEPEVHYVGRLYEETALTYVGRVGHSFALTFVCEPFAVGETVTRAVDGRLEYAGTAETGTVLTLRNVGDVEIGGIRVLVRRLVE